MAALEITDVQATPAVVAGDQNIVHRVTARNNGPSIAPNMRIKVTTTGAPGAPTVTCSDDGTASTSDTCTWAGDTPAGGERWAEFTWTVPVGTASGQLDASYTARSDAPAADDTASASTSIAAEVANLELFGVNAPFRVQPGMAIDHDASVRNTGPSAALNVRLLADYDTALGVPTVTCSAGGSASTFPEIGRTRCTWLGTTPAGGEHSMHVGWITAEDHPLEVLRSTRFQATSSTPGAHDEAIASTTVGDPVLADLSMTTSAPAYWGNGTLVHSATATNNGPNLAEQLAITANIPPTSVIANPTVTCGPDGMANIAGTVATCFYAANTAAGATRTITLTWTAAAADAVVDFTTITVDYLADSPTTGASAAGQTTTEIGPITANLEVSATSAPATWNNGGNLVHTATVRNNGPASTTGFVISATLPPTTTIALPAVTCSNSGVASTVSGVAKCTYSAAVPATGTNTRTITLTWTAAQAAAAGVGTNVSVTYDADATVFGTNATGSTSSVIGVNTADLELSATSAPATWNNGGEPGPHGDGAQQRPGLRDVRLRDQRDAAADDDHRIACGDVLEQRRGEHGVRCGEVHLLRRRPGDRYQHPDDHPDVDARAGVGSRGGDEGDGHLRRRLRSRSERTPRAARRRSIGVTTANLAVTATSAPANAPTGGGLVHTATVTNNGPAATNAIVINATLPTTIAAPVATCSNSGVATQAAPGGVAKCTYPVGTSIAAGATRVITLTWSTASVNTAGAGAVVTVNYTADSPVFGDDASGSTTTTIVPPQADLAVTGGANPATVNVGSTLAQAVTVARTAAALSPATNLKIVATLDSGFPVPTSVTCSTGGTATSPTADTRQCLWAGDTTGTTARTHHAQLDCRRHHERRRRCDRGQHVRGLIRHPGGHSERNPVDDREPGSAASRG